MGDKISELPSASSMNDTDLFAIVQPASGGTTKKIARGAAFGTMATQDATSVNIDGGAIDGTVIGGNSQAAGSFTSLVASATAAAFSLTGVVSATVTTGSIWTLSGNNTITADTGSSQGDGELTKTFNIITTCANSGDAVTLPTASAGLVVIVGNVGANSANVFPNTSDAINALGANNAYALAANNVAIFFALSASQWATVAI